ncbi:MAG: FapA family protein, partial [Methanoregulaceae archaeon]|nr:FapA family protein [Methanoregulaceae archaeon]
LAFYSGDRVSITMPVEDDVFASGGMVQVNAPVSSIIAAGGTVEINAPVTGDVIAAGGTVLVRGPVGGKVVAAGGTVTIDGAVGTNVVLAGGDVKLGSQAHIGRDAAISANRVSNEGIIDGKMMISSQSFENTGQAGSIDIREGGSQKNKGLFSGIFAILPVLFVIGWLILGLVMVRFLPSRFSLVTKEVGRSPVVKTVVGFCAILLAIIGLLLCGVTIVGLPIALVGLMLLAITVILAPLFVSAHLGTWVSSVLKHTVSEWQALVIGFVILVVLVWIPLAGIVVLVVSISLGTGALIYTIRGHWNEISRGMSHE